MANYQYPFGSSYQYPFRGADEQTKQTVWQGGRPIDGYDASVWRHDKCGAVMKYSEHGNTDSDHGWEIDHIIPRAKGGQTTTENLQPLNWKNNRAKGDSYPWACGT
jgi:5-methylcytosine-specific restriction endonuclease McrA